MDKENLKISNIGSFEANQLIIKCSYGWDVSAMSIKSQILITMIVTGIILAAAVLVSNAILFSRYVNTDFESSLLRATNNILNEIYVLENNAAHIASFYFANDIELIDAVESEDSEALARRTHYLFQQTGIELFMVTDSVGRVIAQPHLPEFEELYLTAMRSVRQALNTGSLITNIKGGGGVSLMLSACNPIFNYQGELIGTVLVGFRLDTEEFVDRHATLTGAEIAMFYSSECVATTLKNEHGMRAVGMLAPYDVQKTVLLERVSFVGEISHFGHRMLAQYTPLIDAYGSAVGILFTGFFLYERDEVVLSFVVAGAVITVLLVVISSYIMRLISAKMASPIAKKLDQVHIDALTEIYNRRYFDEKFNEKIKLMSRASDELSLAMLDIDHFKMYNDTYGHQKGDECLKAVAKVLSQTIVREGDFVARYGGEEFVIVMPNTGEDGAHAVAEKIIEKIHDLNIPHAKNDPNRITVSMGVVSGSVKGIESGDVLIKRADELLYNSKANGRNQYTYGIIE
jgi:diguanylate cyclase (GGDEF)-like protein